MVAQDEPLVEDLGVVVPLDLEIGGNKAARISRFTARSVSSVRHWIRRNTSAGLPPGLGVGGLGGFPARSLRR